MSAPTSLGALVRLFLRLGFAGFGGPLVHVAIMETEVVARRRWLSKQEFLDGLALCQMLPGPASTQLAPGEGTCAAADWPSRPGILGLPSIRATSGREQGPR